MASEKSKRRQIAVIEETLRRGYKLAQHFGPSHVIGNLAKGFRIVRTTSPKPLTTGQRKMLESKIKTLQNRGRYLWTSAEIQPVFDSEGRVIAQKQVRVQGTYYAAQHGRLK